jgi:hypothetical protein
VDCASVVSGCCKHPDPGSGAIDEKARGRMTSNSSIELG